MMLWRFVSRTLLYNWRINAAVALSVAAATAVLTGALLVGDSVRASLRALTLDRLGRVEEVLVTDRFFRRELADSLAADHGVRTSFGGAAPVILFSSGTLEHSAAGATARANEVFVIGSDAEFWKLGDARSRPRRLPGADEIVLNQPLAGELKISVGDEVVLRLPKSSQVPADNPLASRTDRIRNVAGLRVVDIIPARSLGQFGLRPRQTVPRNAYVSLETIQNALGVGEKVNAILVSGKEGRAEERDTPRASARLQNALRPKLEDYGSGLKHVRRVFSADDPRRSQVVFDYFSLTTERMVFSPEMEQALGPPVKAMGGQSVLTYLSNSLVKEGEEAAGFGIPYSMIAAIDPSVAFPLRDMEGRPIAPLQSNQIVLTDWAARDQGIHVDDWVRVAYFAPETTHGKAVECFARFQVKAITPLTEPAKPYSRNREAVYQLPPTLANDPDLTPGVQGVTDQETIDAWDAPFPFDYRRVRKKDEDYWSAHRTTPKAFVSLAAGQQLWGSRFGRVTSFRIPAAEGRNEGSIRSQLESVLSKHPSAVGFEFRPVRRQQLDASKGTTPFDVLFLALSFFIIAAALMLVALLFRLVVELRAGQLGTLLALGVRRRRAGWLLMLEGIFVAAVGGLAGVAIGIVYAQSMLYGLRTWWLGAITSPFVQFHATCLSLWLGYSVGVVICCATIAWTVYGVRRVAIRGLLSGQLAGDAAVYRGSRVIPLIALGLLVPSLLLLVGAAWLSGMTQAGAFVGGGALLLSSALVAVWGWLKRGGRVSNQVRRLHLSGLAFRNAARNPLRSAVTVGLIATAVFLIVATSSFRLAPTENGVGGFDQVAVSSEPVFADLNDPAARSELLADRSSVLRGSLVFGLRLRDGDDASCNNLYKPAQPRVLGVTPSLIRYFDGNRPEAFAWSSTAARQPEDRANPWRLLIEPAPEGDDAIPAVVDMNTAFYSLKPPVSVGGVYVASYESGRTLKFRIVGLLENTLLQGSLLIAERDFERAFPDVSGYRYFLIRSPRGQSESVAGVLEDRLGDEGLDAVASREILAQLMSVQNAYLSTFQSLGALGLLLGTLGLAAVQWRNVVERRSELALLRAAGFRHRRLLALVLWENAALLLVGLAIGSGAALAAILPHRAFGAAAIPPMLLRDLSLMLASVLLAGLLASWLSVVVALRAPLLSALRQDG